MPRPFGAGLLGREGFALFLVASFFMGLSSPFYAGPQTALMQEKIPPEYLGRVFGLYGAIMSWAMPWDSPPRRSLRTPWELRPGLRALVSPWRRSPRATWAIPSIRRIEDAGINDGR